MNAVVERDASRLDPVAIIRLAAGGYMKHTPPFVDFPPALARSNRPLTSGLCLVPRLC